MIKFIALALCVGSILADQKSYEGYKVYLVEPVPDHQFELLTKWENLPGFDFWDGLRRNQASRIMVGPGQAENFQAFVTSEGIPAKVVIENVEEYEKWASKLVNLS
jgi:Carboxypeptidase activation peptide